MGRDRRRRLIEQMGGFRLSVTSFTQSLGAELWVNGVAPILFTGDNPNSTTVTGESGADPEATERAPGNTHAGAVGAGGAINLFSSATANAPGLTQTILTAGGWYEAVVDITAVASGAVRVGDSSYAGFNSSNISTVRTIKRIFQAQATTAAMRGQNTAPHDFTIGSISYKPITNNAITPAVANGTFDFLYTEAATKFAGFMIGLQYGMVDAGNGFMLYLTRKTDNSAWDLKWGRIVNNVPASDSVITVGAGVPTGLRVVRNGSSHTLYRLLAGVWTASGSVQTDANFATATGVSAVYSPGTTPLELKAVA
jgi:hypothetical protein